MLGKKKLKTIIHLGQPIMTNELIVFQVTIPTDTFSISNDFFCEKGQFYGKEHRKHLKRHVVYGRRDLFSGGRLASGKFP